MNASWLTVAAVLIAAAALLAAFAAAIYVAYRFLAIAVTIDAAVSRNFHLSRQANPSVTPPSIIPEPAAKPTQKGKPGSFEPYDEEAMFRAEKIRELRREGKDQGLGEEQLAEILAQLEDSEPAG